MSAYDLSPLFRSTVGFDRFDHLFSSALRDTLPQEAYPPYNIEKTGNDSYRITMAVAGFTEDDLEITSERNLLTVKGKQRPDANAEGEAKRFLHRGIATRAFQRKFSLADHIRVDGATVENGLLHIELKLEVPEALKPRQIPITRPDHNMVIEGDRAAA